VPVSTTAVMVITRQMANNVFKIKMYNPKFEKRDPVNYLGINSCILIFL